MDDCLRGVTDFLNEDNIIPPHNLVPENEENQSHRQLLSSYLWIKLLLIRLLIHHISVSDVAGAVRLCGHQYIIAP